MSDKKKVKKLKVKGYPFHSTDPVVELLPQTLKGVQPGDVKLYKKQILFMCCDDNKFSECLDKVAHSKKLKEVSFADCIGEPYYSLIEAYKGGPRVCHEYHDRSPRMWCWEFIRDHGEYTLPSFVSEELNFYRDMWRMMGDSPLFNTRGLLKDYFGIDDWEKRCEWFYTNPDVTSNSLQNSKIDDAPTALTNVQINHSSKVKKRVKKSKTSTSVDTSLDACVPVVKNLAGDEKCKNAHATTQETYTTTSLLEYTKKNIPVGWKSFFDVQLEDGGNIENISKILHADTKKGVTIFPPLTQVYTVFDVVKPENVNVVILGQDPYINRGEAMGLSFSVPNNIKTPPSLRNIFKELYDDVGVSRTNPDLTDWAKQGVFLLNTILTVKEGISNSYKDVGWEDFTDGVLRYLIKNRKNLVFVLWGKQAQEKERIIKGDHPHRGVSEGNFIIKSAHPSPLSAKAGFFGSKPFSKINTYLKKNKIEEIRW